MGFRLHCDRCGRFVRTVNSKQLKDLENQDAVCATCERIERVIQANVEQIKKKAMIDFQKMADSYKEIIAETVKQKVVEIEDGDSG